MSRVKIGKATGRRLRRYPAKNGEKSTVERRVAKFAEAKNPFNLPVSSVNIEARHRETRCAKRVINVADLLPISASPDTLTVLREQAQRLADSLIRAADKGTLMMLCPLLARLVESTNRMK